MPKLDAIKVVMGYARFKSDHEVEVKLNEGGTTTFTAPHVVVCVGGVPSPLGAPGQEHVIDRCGSIPSFCVSQTPPNTTCTYANIFAELYVQMCLSSPFTYIATQRTRKSSHSTFVKMERECLSDDFFDIEEQPKKALVIGAGYIAVEMAGILGGLGTKTSLMFRGETVLRRGFDPFIVRPILSHTRYINEGPEFHGGLSRSLSLSLSLVHSVIH